MRDGQCPSGRNREESHPFKLRISRSSPRRSCSTDAGARSEALRAQLHARPSHDVDDELVLSPSPSLSVSRGRAAEQFLSSRYRPRHAFSKSLVFAPGLAFEKFNRDARPAIFIRIEFYKRLAIIRLGEIEN